MELNFELDDSHPFYQLAKRAIQSNTKPELVLRNNHPFYRLANFVQQLNSPNSPSVSSLIDIQNIYNSTLISSKKINWTSLDISELEEYIEFIEKKMGEFASTKCPFAYQRVLRLILLVFQDIYALSNVKGSKRHFKTKMEEKICELLISLSVFSRTHEVDLQLADSYAREALSMLQDTPGQFEKGVRNKKILVQMNLALIYLKLGYTESALKILSEASVNQVYDIDFMDQFCLLLEGYQAVIEYFHTKDLFVALILCRDLNSYKEIYMKGITEDRISGKITSSQYKYFIKNYQEITKKIPALVLKTHHDYKAKLFDAIKYNINFSIIEKIEFDSENYQIQLKLSDDIDDSIIQKSIKANKLISKSYNKNEITWYIFDVDVLISQKLEKICLDINKIRQNEAKKIEEVSRTMSVKENFVEAVNLLSAVDKADCIPGSDSRSYMEPVFFKENKPLSPLPLRVKNNQNKTASINVKSVNDSVAKSQKVLSPLVEYTWEQSDMEYSSVNKQCSVKPLGSACIPGSVWFGYIPEWISRDSQYDPEFFHRLCRGSIKMDCIRDITKELLTWNDQNFSNRYPYKFKIVIPNNNKRLYGWIDDVCKDQEGKMHYLVCFGFIADHETRFLPNPETLKRKNELISQPKLCK